MYLTDMVVDEARRMALIIAKLLGIKATGTFDEYRQEFNNILESEYNTELEKLIHLSQEDFDSLIKGDLYSSEKLNALSQMLYVFAEPFERNEETQLLLKKVMAIFDVLEEKYHFQSFDNLTKRSAIYGYFNIKL
ncbi:hypothetical protein [Mucilaginibacter antarcticus]|uniref:Tellurite resistance protein TerB n=1 Tax=Mucilaginibacter antarcticus TaxID=1855725 RepID=A0ABW5XMH2_9SPHI